jgi:hypothetical protein
MSEGHSEALAGKDLLTELEARVAATLPSSTALSLGASYQWQSAISKWIDPGQRWCTRDGYVL